MRNFSEFLHSANGLNEAANIEFVLIHTKLGKFSHLTEEKNAVFINGVSHTYVPLLLGDGKENPELRIIWETE